jgi:hypothetical protein
MIPMKYVLMKSGIGKPTERSYFYRKPDNPFLLTKYNHRYHPHHEGNIDHGVILGEGDGTVNFFPWDTCATRDGI